MALKDKAERKQKIEKICNERRERERERERERDREREWLKVRKKAREKARESVRTDLNNQSRECEAMRRLGHYNPDCRRR